MVRYAIVMTCSPCLICFHSFPVANLCKQFNFLCLTAAPEVISNKKHYDGVMADVWSSGVMLYVMLFGQYPFERPEDKKEANRCSKLTPWSCLTHLGEDNRTLQEHIHAIMLSLVLRLHGMSNSKFCLIPGIKKEANLFAQPRQISDLHPCLRHAGFRRCYTVS